MSKLSRDQILKMLKREVKDHKALARGIRGAMTGFRPHSDTIEQAEALRDTVTALSTLEYLVLRIREREAK